MGKVVDLVSRVKERREKENLEYEARFFANLEKLRAEFLGHVLIFRQGEYIEAYDKDVIVVAVYTGCRHHWIKGTDILACRALRDAEDFWISRLVENRCPVVVIDKPKGQNNA